MGGKAVLVIDSDSYYYNPFESAGEFTNKTSLLRDDPESIGLVVFTGGADVEPSLYGQKPCHRTSTHPARDTLEVGIFKQVLELKIPMAGICRGSQFLCVMAGGQLVQHLSNHSGDRHNIATNDGRVINVNSTHHQMMLPSHIPHVLLAWSHRMRSEQHFIEKNGRDTVIEVPCEYECVYFPKINALGMQYHPEGMAKNTPGFQYATELTEKLLTNKLSID